MKFTKESEEKVYDGFLKIYEAQFKTNGKDNSLLKQNSKLKKNDAVAVLVFNNETQKFVFVRQFRYPIEDREPENLIEIPAGTIDDGESPLDAVKRELLEEVGYKTDEIQEIYEFYPSIGYSSEKVHLFMCIVSNEDKVDNGGGLEEEGEFLDIIELTLDNVYELLDYGAILDAKTLIALQEFKIKHQNSMLQEENEVIEELKNKIKDLETKNVLLQSRPK